MYRVSLLIVCLAGYVSAANAGPWTRKQGHGFVQLGFSTLGYNKIYDDGGDKQPVFGDARDNVVQLFAEYGLLDDLTLTAAVPFKFLSFTPTHSLLAPLQSKATNNGIGDIDLAVRYKLFDEAGYVFANAIQFGVPAGDSKDPNGLWIGDGEFNVMLRVAVGKSFYPDDYYISGDLGYNFRGRGFSNEFLYNVEFGYGFFDATLYLIVLVSGKESTSSVPTATITPALLGFSTNNQEYTAFIPKVVYRIAKGWGVAASFATASHGRNIGGGFVFAAGVFYDF